MMAETWYNNKDLMVKTSSWLEFHGYSDTRKKTVKLIQCDTALYEWNDMESIGISHSKSHSIKSRRPSKLKETLLERPTFGPIRPIDVVWRFKFKSLALLCCIFEPANQLIVYHFFSLAMHYACAVVVFRLKWIFFCETTSHTHSGERMNGSMQ